MALFAPSQGDGKLGSSGITQIAILRSSKSGSNQCKVLPCALSEVLPQAGRVQQVLAIN